MTILQVTLSFCLLLSALGLDKAYVREYHDCRNHPQLLKACFAPGFSLLTLFTVGAVAFSRELAFLLYGVDDPLLFALTTFCVFAGYISRFLSLILRMQERGLAFSMSQVIPKALQLALLGLLVWLGWPRNF